MPTVLALQTMPAASTLDVDCWSFASCASQASCRSYVSVPLPQGGG